jgi:hypothetical protein
VRRLLATCLAACLLLAVSAVPAPAAPITLGSNLTGSFTTSSCGVPCTIFNIKVAGSNPIASPIDGAIVRWRIIGGTPGLAGYAIRVLRPTGATYTAVGTSSPATPIGTGIETFNSMVPIKAGDKVGIDTPATAALPLASNAGAEYGGWLPPLAEGASSPFVGPIVGKELGYNADVQPAPAVSLISPSAGSFKGGQVVTVAGSDFAGVKQVLFGSVPSQVFQVGSEGQLTAVAPAAAGPSVVDVSVVTVAGTSPAVAGDHFTYEACVVPKLKGKKLKAARKALGKADCKLGKVTRRKHARKSPRVLTQSAKAGAVLRPGARVSVKLG